MQDADHTEPRVVAAPDRSRPLSSATSDELSHVMSPAQAVRLAELRAEHPEWTYTPFYVHGISGMLEVSVRRPGLAALIIGITGSGGDVAFALVARSNGR